MSVWVLWCSLVCCGRVAISVSLSSSGDCACVACCPCGLTGSCCDNVLWGGGFVLRSLSLGCGGPVGTVPGLRGGGGAFGRVVVGCSCWRCDPAIWA